MGCESKTCMLVLPFLLLSAWYMQRYCVYGEPQVPCLFIFGDSLSDSGNNNNLKTIAKANYKPYGIDFPAGPTGRFTNGRTAIDIITQLLGFENFIPPFANTSGSDILKGVNYASGSAGIRRETGKHLGENIGLGSQLTNHKAIVSQIETLLGNAEKTQEHLKKCLYYVNIGSNDFINNYFLPQFYSSSRFYTHEQYAEALIQELSSNLMALRAGGARKYVLVGLGFVGCIPKATSNRTNGSCVLEQNIGPLIFSDKLRSVVDQFNKHFSTDSKLIFINSTAKSTGDLSGFKVLNAGCCSTRTDGQCVPDKTPCVNKNEYVFWDQFHPTEASSLHTAIASYNASNTDLTYPMDINHLVHHQLK
ncbi:PREDICTED: GDSL esterase/lipase At1g29670-like [Lupinus angustifolius]|uniref:GDSL esterase/lipase At1g29670-like n=1 Tax=Lupinus angustifolius TaxID=3871 RepID=UPI00092FCB89|nr:PREDICTED: GDSL esterase/lipase At1g29670-like [Lupinus angustifolius]